MRKLIRRHLPCPDSLREHRCLAMFGNTLLHPRLWHLNRHSAAGGLAIGLFCSLIPGPLQMLGAVILCVLFRVNLPLALVGTWFSNPFTIVPLYIVAFGIGRFVTQSDAAFQPPPAIDFNSMGQSLQAWGHWMLGLGYPLLIGLPLLALLLALIAYFGVKLAWEFHLRRLHSMRQKQHEGP